MEEGFVVGKREHEHSKTGEWIGERQINDALGVDPDRRDVHHHKVTDTDSGKTGSGSGWSRQEAEQNAEDDLNKK